MDIEEQTQPNPAADTPDPNAGAETQDPTAATGAEPQQGKEDPLAALDRGIAEVSPEDAEAPAPKPEASTDPAAADKPPGDAAAKAAADAAQGDKPKPGEKPQAAAKPEPDAEIEAEIKSLQLKQKAADRFRTMATEIKAFAPIKEALDKAGIKDAATFQQAMPQLVQRSQDFEDMVTMVSETGATPEMYTAALDYLKNTNAAAQGDPAAAQRCYDQTLNELQVWAKLLGKEIPGIVDPLAAHPDLQREVEAGDLARERALEIVHQRSTAHLIRGRDERTQQQSADAQARTQGAGALNNLEGQLRAADADYDRKRPFFIPAVRRIVAKFPPSEWAAEAQRAYAEIPALPKEAAPAPAPAGGARPLPGPVRGGARMAVAQVPKDPMEALEFGLSQVGG